MLFYDKTNSGAVIDAETNKPIEGAIVVGMWRLSQFPGEGFGGYAKVTLVTTDKDGRFAIPWWVRFKPWKFYMYLTDLAPEIYIYKPGYKFHSSHKKSRLGYSSAYEMSAEERRKLYDKHAINPARLVRIYSDQDRLDNYEMIEMKTEFPSNLYSSDELILFAKSQKEELIKLSDNNNRKITLLSNIEELLSKR